MKAAEVTEEKLKTGRMAVIFSLTYAMGFFISAGLMAMVIHQAHLYSIFADIADAKDPNSEVGKYFSDFMAKYGNLYRTFKHGAFHGTLTSIMFVMTIISIVAMFERRGFKYIVIHTGYWAVTLALMGGAICQFAKF